MNDYDVILWIVFIIVLVILCFAIYKYVRWTLKHKIEVITAFTGGLGSGKTNLSVDYALRLLFRNRRKLKRIIMYRKIRNKILFWKKPKNVVFEEPMLFSNIPVIIKKPSKLMNWFRRLLHLQEKKPVFCSMLTQDHLLLQSSIPKGSVILLDEIGAWASQMEFNNPNIIDTFDEFVRFYRHYYAIPTTNIEPYMVVNDQCSENINYVIRRRLNMIHNLSNYLRIWRFAFYYERMISISEEIKTVDTRTGIQNDTQDNSNFRFKFFWLTKRYDSHCYSERAQNLPRRPFKEFEQLKTNAILKCPKGYDKSYIHAKTK